MDTYSTQYRDEQEAAAQAEQAYRNERKAEIARIKKERQAYKKEVDAERRAETKAEAEKLRDRQRPMRSHLDIGGDVSRMAGYASVRNAPSCGN